MLNRRKEKDKLELLMEIPSIKEVGGVDTYIKYLSLSLRKLGNDISFCDASYFDSLKDLDCYIEQGRYDVFLPLAWDDYHRYPKNYSPKFLNISVKVWHDISLFCPFYGINPETEEPCTNWYSRFSCCRVCIEKRKNRIYLPPSGGYATESEMNILPSNLPIRIPRSRIVPLAASHIPKCNLCDPSGPMLVLAGKISVRKLEKVIFAVSKSSSVRIIFSNWTQQVIESKKLIWKISNKIPLQLISYYTLPEDMLSVFGGLSSAILLDDYYEMFPLLGLELVRCGIPVVCLSSSGDLRNWASRVFSNLDSLISAISGGKMENLSPIKSPLVLRTWNDVARDFNNIFKELVNDGG